ncbi:DUF1835 domain-containing protein [Photobacterium sp. GJ3]|uniref:DUF1835 domain-containing protein n=1 Tax=Photobacterium sp. GJ3 TaxID=2829502 RepID=UPI001B8B2518|nr:DUF1835 domain-containing protein [Photobacterium sp. GJ3]QUJ67463.1 DUF1835 domain-containing protein [Photobacterium sp. GJ3]
MMKADNAFSLSLVQLKSQAKRTLKAVRRGDEAARSFLQKNHPVPQQITIETIRLADVQLALARSLGMPSWPKLKHHLQTLEVHKQAIAQGSPSLDRELFTLHIRCGHDIQQPLKTAGFQGEFLPFIDPHCMGPLSAGMAFERMRATYIHQFLLSEVGDDRSVEHLIAQTRQQLDSLLDDKFQRLVFWVEHDSYDQLMLLRLLAFLADEPAASSREIELIEVNQYPGRSRFIGLGQLPAEGLRALWQQRRRLDTGHFKFAQQIWQAFCSPSPAALIAASRSDAMTVFPNLPAVIVRHLQELPHGSTGLSLTQMLALRVLENASAPLRVSDWFQAYQPEEPLPYLGDLMFWVLLKPLLECETPLISAAGIEPHQSWLDHEISITAFGRAVLSGKARVRLSEYWVGGICVRPESCWIWDHESLSTLKFENIDI